MVPSIAPQHLSVPEKLQRNKDTVRRATLGKEVPGHRKEQQRQTLIVILALDFVVPNNRGARAPPNDPFDLINDCNMLWSTVS